MPIPRKALKESQLVKETNSAVNGGSHQIERVTFINEQGQKKAAFFKRISEEHNYRALLGLISVATSAFKRLFQGEHSAEERLIFDDEEQLVGTLSVAIDDFKPFNFITEPIPDEVEAKERVVPSTKTLIAKNIMEILVGRYFLDDDDAHPHNLGFSGDHAVDIDFDMFWYWFTVEMKGARPGLGVTRERRVNLTVTDWERFPMIREANIYHWPTYTHPGKESVPNVLPAQESILTMMLPKAYCAPEQFQALAGNAEAQAQKITAALKILLTHQPDVIRARLVDLFGDMPFNYTSLGARLSKKYEELYPSLCYAKTKQKSFVDFMLMLYQKHYDNLYRIVVFYLGCADNGYGLSIPPTYETLYRKPSFYKGIVRWIQKQNETLYGHEGNISLKYNGNQLQQRYHQIWRDSFAPLLNMLLDDLFKLTSDCLLKVTSQNNNSSVTPLLAFMEGKTTADDAFTESAQYFSIFTHFNIDKVKLFINVEKNSPLHQAISLLIVFTNSFDVLVKKYYQKDFSSLANEDNTLFIEQVRKLLNEHKVIISEKLGVTTSWATRFDALVARMEQFVQQINFIYHLTTTDEQMEQVLLNAQEKEDVRLNDPIIIARFNDALFTWAKQFTPVNETSKELTQILNNIFDKYYSNGSRAQLIKNYLARSELYDGDNRLAYILASGNETSRLNTVIIQRLIPEILHTRPNIFPDRSDELLAKNIPVFVQGAVAFAKNEPRLIHLYNIPSIELFFNTFYLGVNSLPLDEFNLLMTTALNQRYPSRAMFGFLNSNDHKKALVIKLFNKSSEVGQAKALASIFVQGDEYSKLNELLFHSFISHLQKKIKSDAIFSGDKPGCQLIAQYNSELHKDIYLKDNLKCYAIKQTQQQQGYYAYVAAQR